MDPEDPAAFLGSTSSSKTMADGSLRITIDLQPTDAIGAFTAFGSPGSPVAVARIQNQAAVEAGRPKAVKGPFGEYARALVLSGFFKAPPVWENLGGGDDEDYLEWLKTQKSAKSEKYGWYDNGQGFCVPAHYRRVNRGSGTGIKPQFSAIPLTNEEHQLQHQKGHDAIGTDGWWEAQCLKYAERWAYETLKKRLNYDSYTEIAPHRIVAWCRQRELENLLPRIFRDAESQEHQEASEA